MYRLFQLFEHGFSGAYLRRLCTVVLCLGMACVQAVDDDDDLTLDDFRARNQEVATAAHGLKQRTLLLRLSGKIDSDRGRILSGAAELADAVRMLMQAGIRYQERPDAEVEVFQEVLTQMRYLAQHTAAEFQDQEYWSDVRRRLMALGPPAYALAGVMAGLYLPAVEAANEMAEAEARLAYAVQELFDAFLLLRGDDDEDSVGDASESDSEDEDESDSEDESGSEDEDSTLEDEEGRGSDSDSSGSSEGSSDVSYEDSSSREDGSDWSDEDSEGESNDSCSDADVLSCDSGYSADQSSDGDRISEWLDALDAKDFLTEYPYWFEVAGRNDIVVLERRSYSARRKQPVLVFPSSSSTVSFY